MSAFREAYGSLSTAQKPRKGVSHYSVLVNRPLGRLLAAGAYVAGLSPSAVTLISALVTLAGVLVLMLLEPSVVTGVLVWLLLALGFALDSADGQVARLRNNPSLAGEWFDHTVDAAKMVLLHTAVLVGWYRFADLDEAWLVVPLAYQMVAVVTFSGLTIVGLLKRQARLVAATGPVAAVSEPRPTTLRSLVLLPGDYGLLCFAFVLWGLGTVFAYTYLTLMLLNAALMAAYLIKWFLELSELD